MLTYVIILNYDNGSVDQFELPLLWDSCDSGEIEEYIERELDYNLSSCHWMCSPSPVSVNNHFQTN